jgi:hypothetical protein
MHLGIIRVSERCRLGIWFLATRRAGRRAAGQAAPIQLLIGSVARGCWCSSTSSFSRFKRDAPALSVLNTASRNCDGSSGTVRMAGPKQQIFGQMLSDQLGTKGERLLSGG